jgi:hypothetical protein
LKLVTFAVPLAAVLFVWCGAASAHPHHSSYRHDSYRHAHAHGVPYGRHLYAMYGNDVATGSFSSQYFASPYAAQNTFSGYGPAPSARYDNVSTMAASQAGTAGLPASLVERVIRRESGGNPRAVHAGNYGLMQIRLGTARAMGYTGSAAGLLDPQTNMTYALRYLAGAYRAAGGNESRAVALYSRGYYAQAKAQAQAQGFSPYSGTSSASGWGFGNYGQGSQAAFQTSFQPAFQTAAWPAEQYGLRHRRHYHV